jgi:TPR repeat protein
MGGKAALFFIAAAPWLLAGCIFDPVWGLRHANEAAKRERAEQRRARDEAAEQAWAGFHANWDRCVAANSADACYRTGAALELGKAVDADVKKARWFFERACSLQSTQRHCAAAKRSGG